MNPTQYQPNSMKGANGQETRLRLLNLKPQIRQNWTALAVGHHLQGDPAQAVSILAAFENTLNVRLPFSNVLNIGSTP